MWCSGWRCSSLQSACGRCSVCTRGAELPLEQVSAADVLLHHRNRQCCDAHGDELLQEWQLWVLWRGQSHHLPYCRGRRSGSCQHGFCTDMSTHSPAGVSASCMRTQTARPGHLSAAANIACSALLLTPSAVLYTDACMLLTYLRGKPGLTGGANVNRRSHAHRSACSSNHAHLQPALRNDPHESTQCDFAVSIRV
jgi:hypothetical protein